MFFCRESIGSTYWSFSATSLEEAGRKGDARAGVGKAVAGRGVAVTAGAGRVFSDADDAAEPGSVCCKDAVCCASGVLMIFSVPSL
jgi:hypothetical protein